MSTNAPAAAAVTDFSQYTQLRALARNQDPQALRKVAQQFEAVFTQMMLKAMRDASPGDDLLGGGQTGFYQDMFDQQLAAQMSTGKGLGLADMMVRQLKMSEALGKAEAAPPVAGMAVSGLNVIPAQAGIQFSEVATPSVPGPKLDARLRGHDAIDIAFTPDVAFTPATTTDETPAEPDFAPGTPAQFIAQVLPHAERAGRELGISPRVLIAQAALETGWGRHMMRDGDGKATLNFFNIKADKRWDGARVAQSTLEFEDGQMQRTQAAFRSYGSIAEAFADYTKFLKSNPRYAEALRHGGSETHFAVGLQKAGYATDPAYAQKVLRIARSGPLTV